MYTYTNTTLHGKPASQSFQSSNEFHVLLSFYVAWHSMSSYARDPVGEWKHINPRIRVIFNLIDSQIARNQRGKEVIYQ